MDVPQANPGRVFDIHPLGLALASTRSSTLVKSDNLEIIRLVVRAEEEHPTYEAPGPVLLQCLEGRAALTVRGVTRDLGVGQLVYLPPGEPHSLRGIRDASLLLVIFHPPAEVPSVTRDIVEEASVESFPASDAPSWTPTTSLGGPPH